jgi:hypothetical protein
MVTLLRKAQPTDMLSVIRTTEETIPNQPKTQAESESMFHATFLARFNSLSHEMLAC